MKDETRQRPRDLKSRTRQSALRVVRLYMALPKTTLAQVLGKQVLRSGTSVGSHYREGVRGPSNAEPSGADALVGPPSRQTRNSRSGNSTGSSACGS
jgi:hypothetical protein